jgi:hypothetical protein
MVHYFGVKLLLWLLLLMPKLLLLEGVVEQTGVAGVE